MKKVFLLLAAIGLAVASCTPDGGGKTPGGNGGNGGNEGAGEFTITVSEIAATSAHIKVEAKEATRTFYANVVSKAAFAEFDMNALHAEMVALVADGQYTWAQLLDKGVAEWTTSKVTPNAEFVVYAFGIDANGNLTSAEPSYKTFKTLESTFDPASWTGFWTVTSPKTFVQETNLLTEENEESWTDDELTRDIEIVDGATLDASLAGYAIVYGWDGNFLDQGPAFGVYNDNKIELLKDEVIAVFEEDGIMYQWHALSDLPTYAGGTYGITVGGEYPAYVFTMDANGAVTINPYIGQITSGDEFYVSAFTIWCMTLDGEGYYPWIYDEPAYTFSGKNITAVKSVAPAPAPAKLSAKKNIKVMHKMANQKFVANKFSAAVNFAK